MQYPAARTLLWHNTSVRAAIYVRISQDREGAGLGVERQRQDCATLAAREGWEVSTILVDNDVSAHTGKRGAKRREGYAQLLELIGSGAVQRVVVWHTDRLLRSSRELETYITASEAHAVATHAVTAGHLDLTNATGRMQARIGAAIAQHEVEHRAERMKRKQQQLVEAGKWIGGTRPFGWQIDADGRPVIDEAEAAVLRDTCERVLAGVSLGTIIRDLNDTGVTSTTGRAWGYATLRQVLLRSRNAGIVTYSGERVEPSGWPPIVDEATWRQVTALLTDPTRRRSTSNRVKWLMAGLARCECGARVRSAAVGTRAGETAAIYRCPERGPGHVGRRAHEVDELVTRTVIGYLNRPDTLAALRAIHAPGRPDRDLAAEAQTLRTRLDEAAGLYADGALTGDQLRRISGELRPQLDAVEAQMATASGAGALAPFLAGEERAGDVWQRLGIEERRAVVAQLMVVTLMRTDRKSGRFFNPETIKIEWAASLGD